MPATTPPPAELHRRVIDWYGAHRRTLPWREDPDPWRVMVSEFMLQQTPVVRVLPVFEAWLERWPTPADLAASPAGEAVRAWGRLGYPRRALRLHAAATAIVESHGGAVPGTYDELLTLPGVGDYTAAAIASFAYGRRAVVLDTNVRRVFARVVSGVQYPSQGVLRAERDLATSLLPEDDAVAAAWAASTMELGAVVCTARAPRCEACPIADACRWRAVGYPPHDGPPRRGQPWHGTDRQCRGALMAVVRDAAGPVAPELVAAAWSDAAQRERCLDSLLDDGLLDLAADGRLTLPG
ncbi:A/G-specific adenine glycosylase [Aeromicrobium sp. Marseille-Q0843]|uniref:Adenine DNA glycosylase n=1 Tax=Aeromicrobium phoceense TaxID=2754045 RepID=A0A838XJS9_9ACTN|nr:A/G-specific adenine glycosylase [Aeromicrobium phoceense]MBA4607130.1 A/G-specific adenine glycosylase [Aeromicrobium phoceense]